jgi:putative membrane protein
VIAIILGVYRDLVRIASNPFKRLKENLLFCLPLGIGAAASGVLSVLAFQFLFANYAKATALLFVGLIAGNLHAVFSQVKKSGFRPRYLIGVLPAFAAALAFALLRGSAGAAEGAQGLTASLPVLAISGFLAGVAAPIPGMSVSMVLMLFGVYGQLLFAAHTLLHLEFAYLLPFGLFGLCAVIGMVLAARLIKFVFERRPGFANAMVLGFMAGSLTGILARSLRMPDEGFTWLLGGIMLAAGAGISVGFVVLGKRMGK